MSDEMQGVENTSASPEQHNPDSANTNNTNALSSGLQDGQHRETNAVVPAFLLHHADLWHPVFSSIADDKISKAVSSGFIPSDSKIGSILLEGRGPEFLSQPLNRILEEIEGIFSIDNDVSLEIPALAPLVFNINNSFCEDLTISDVHFAHTGAAGVDCPIVARLLIEPHHFANVWNSFVQGAESLGTEHEESAATSDHGDAMEAEHDQNQQGTTHVPENSAVAVSQDSIPRVVDTAPSAQEEEAEEHENVDAPSPVDDLPAPNETEADAQFTEEQDVQLEPEEDVHAEELPHETGAEEVAHPENVEPVETVEESAAHDSVVAPEIHVGSGIAAEDVRTDGVAEETEAADVPDILDDTANEPIDAPEDDNDDQQLNELDAYDLPDVADSEMEVPDDLGDLEGLEDVEDDAQNSKKRSRDDSQNGNAELDHQHEDSELQETEPKRLKTDAEHVPVVEHVVAAN